MTSATARCTRRWRRAVSSCTTESQRLTPGNADAATAQRLHVASGSLLLTIEQVDMTAEGIPVLVSREHHLADAFEFTVVRHGPGIAAEEPR